MSSGHTAGIPVDAALPAERFLKKVRRRWSGPTQPWWGFVFTLPILALLVCFKFWPMAYAAWLSLTNASLTERTWRFIGVYNYVRLVRDTTFIGALETTGRYVGATIARAPYEPCPERAPSVIPTNCCGDAICSTPPDC